jgi:hypothetical protein
MNVRATLSNDRTVKANGGGTVVIRATQDIFEAIVEILKCLRSIETAAA